MEDQICPVCSVKIEENARVVFSCGPTGTRERLRARVCNFIANDPDKAAKCINQGDFKLTAADRYGSFKPEIDSFAIARELFKEVHGFDPES